MKEGVFEAGKRKGTKELRKVGERKEAMKENGVTEALQDGSVEGRKEGRKEGREGKGTGLFSRI
jgi:hypothetical protein